MNMILMSKNVPIAELEINDGFIVSIKKMENPEYLPLIARLRAPAAAAAGLRKWLEHRSIPRTRKNLSRLLQEAGVDSSNALSIKNLGLNLSDQYWFRPAGSDIQWEDVNLFQNDFKPRQFGTSKSEGPSYSPDSSSNGELPKFWCIKDGERYLYKGSISPFYQQSYNEVFAAKILDLLDIPHVSYTLEQIENTTYSVCKTFITPDTEYIPALHILDARKQKNHENDYQHFLACVETLGIPCSQTEVDTMLSFDYLVHNNDRHYGNFGFIRDANTLEFKGPAPLFDHGNSLWYNKITKDMKFRNQESKPFKDTQEKQIQLTQTIPLLLNKLPDAKIHALVQETYADNPYMDKDRLAKLSDQISILRQQLINRQNTPPGPGKPLFQKVK